MIQCKDVYTMDIIFENSEKTIMHSIARYIDQEQLQLNGDLSDILVENVDSVEYDYLINRQDKMISPLFERILDHNPTEEDHLTKVTLKLAKIIINKFLKGWSKLADAVFADYNPIENYNMKENRETDFEEHTVTDNDQKVTNKYSGFNSGDSMTPVSESDTEGDIETTKTDTGHKATNELTRTGNIGVTTSQQMIESSYNLARKNLVNLIYKNIDSVLFIDYYCY